MQYYFLADLHIDEGLFRRTKDRHNKKVLHKLKELEANAPPGSTAVLGGDIVHSPSKRAFKEAKAILDQIEKINKKVGSGNHDYAIQGFLHLRNFEELFQTLPGTSNNPLRFWVQGQDLHILLDSCEGLGTIPGPRRLARGRLGTDLLNRLQHILKVYKPLVTDRKGRVYVYLHHHIFEKEGKGLELMDAKEFRQILIDSGLNFNVYMGHMHTPGEYIWPSMNVYAVGKYVDDGHLVVKTY